MCIRDSLCNVLFYSVYARIYTEKIRYIFIHDYALSYPEIIVDWIAPKMAEIWAREFQADSGK